LDARALFGIRLFEQFGIWFGDCPHDYLALLASLGYRVEVEPLGWGGMYQYIRARR